MSDWEEMLQFYDFVCARDQYLFTSIAFRLLFFVQILQTSKSVWDILKNIVNS